MEGYGRRAEGCGRAARTCTRRVRRAAICRECLRSASSLARLPRGSARCAGAHACSRASLPPLDSRALRCFWKCASSKLLIYYIVKCFCLDTVLCTAVVHKITCSFFILVHCIDIYVPEVTVTSRRWWPDPVSPLELLFRFSLLCLLKFILFFY